MQPIVHLLSVAGSSSQCGRCTAMSKRTKEQCGRPALKTSKTQKWQFHGGRRSGPKTPEGRQRVAQAHTVHMGGRPVQKVAIDSETHCSKFCQPPPSHQRSLSRLLHNGYILLILSGPNR